MLRGPRSVRDPHEINQLAHCNRSLACALVLGQRSKSILKFSQQTIDHSSFQAVGVEVYSRLNIDEVIKVISGAV